MKRALTVGVTGAALLIAVTAVAAPRTGQDAPWLHIRVVEHGDSGSRVNVNLPLSLVEVALDLAEAEIAREGHFHMHHSDVEVADLRRAWSELRDAGDAEFVTVEEDDEHVRISRQGDRVLIEIRDARTEDLEETGRIEVPVSVVDVLLEGEGNELNLRGALQELVRTQRGDLVRIEDRDASVRIWIE